VIRDYYFLLGRHLIYIYRIVHIECGEAAARCVVVSLVQIKLANREKVFNTKKERKEKDIIYVLVTLHFFFFFFTYIQEIWSLHWTHPELGSNRLPCCLRTIHPPQELQPTHIFTYLLPIFFVCLASNFYSSKSLAPSLLVPPWPCRVNIELFGLATVSFNSTEQGSSANSSLPMRCAFRWPRTGTMFLCVRITWALGRWG